MLELTKVTWSHLQYNLNQVPIFFWWRHEQKYDAITFTSQYFYFKKVQNPLKTRKTLKELCNKRQSISVFSNTAKVVNFRWKNADAGRFEINIAWILHTRTFIFASHLFFSVPFDLIYFSCFLTYLHSFITFETLVVKIPDNAIWTLLENPLLVFLFFTFYCFHYHGFIRYSKHRLYYLHLTP